MRKINILGSCVTRDAFSKTQRDFHIEKYVARHSLHSIVSKPLIDSKELRKILDSNTWNQEMLFEDISKNSLDVFNCEFLIVDLVDERLNYYQIEDIVLTETFMLNKSNILNDYPNKKLIKRGSKVDLDQWRETCKKLKEKLVANNIKVIFHEAFFSTHYKDENGQLVAFENQNKIENQNKNLKHFQEIFKEIIEPHHIISIDRKNLIGSIRKGTYEPFHYIPEYYKELIVELKSIFNTHYPIEQIPTHKLSSHQSEWINLFHKEPLVSVIMTTYNVQDYVHRAIMSILNQTYKKLELIIVDDNSSDNTIEIIKKINDPRIKLYRNTINSGTYFCKNYGITQSRGSFIAIQDSDDHSSPVRIEKQLNEFSNNPETQIVKCQYVRVTPKGKILTEPKAAFQASMIRKEVFDTMGYYDTVRVAADDEFDCRAKIVFGRKKIRIIPELLYYNLMREDSLTSSIKIGGEERIMYVENFSNWHKENANAKQNLVVEYPNVNRGFEVHKNIQVKNQELFEGRFIEEKTVANTINASVVSFPKREKQFKKVVKDVLPQVDHLYVYLNNYTEVPAFLKHENITVYLDEENGGDIGDNGKFYKKEGLKGFHITIDDDIKYPKDYIAKLVDKLEYYSYQTVVGLHGIDILYDTFEHYYERNSREVFSYPHKLAEDRQVHILGTGTVAYHTNLLKIDYSEINLKFMVDIFFAIQVNRQLIPMICVDREKGWMSDYETDEETKIYTTFKRNDDSQTKLVLDHEFTKPVLNVKGINNNAAIVLNSHDEDVLKQLNKSERELRKLKAKLSLLESNNSKIKEEREWYSRTFDHLPLWFIKTGSIFRLIKVNKGFE